MSPTRLALIERELLEQEPVCPYTDARWEEWVKLRGWTPTYALDLVAESVWGRSVRCPEVGGCSTCTVRMAAIRRWAKERMTVVPPVS